MRKLMFLILILLAMGCNDELEAKPNLLKSLDELYANTSIRGLAEAAGNGDVKLIEKLAAKGVDVNSTGANGMPVLFWPLREQNKEGFQKLLEMGANPDLQWSTGSSITELVAGIEDTDYLNMVLKAGGNPNLINAKSNKPPIFQAVKFGFLDNIKILLDSGADIDNATNSAGETPIFDALALGDYKTALFLAKSGANLKVTDTWGNPVGFSLKNRLDTPEIGDSNYQYYREFLSILNADPIKQQ
ncbi:ankyrin repeat domain-containing protein [Shewanella sp. CAL98-MNA-CIBAN-0140]|uniref:ankyrin repeat domain-containing protein n=1 Tax=Shewanella sp. CAL98-MNA-CIBAN-0140 TaxID=3140462 RepID=UPI003324DF33